MAIRWHLGTASIRETVRHRTTRAPVRLPPHSRCPARGDSDCPPPPSFARLVGGRAIARARSRLASRGRSLSRAYFASTASCTASMTFCVLVAFSHLSWPIVVLECTSLPATVTSKLPVVPGSCTSSIAMSSPNSAVSVEASAVKYFLYPHPPQYWIEMLTAESAIVVCACVEECEAPSAETARRFLRFSGP